MPAVRRLGSVRLWLPNANAPGCEKHDTLNHSLSRACAEPLIVLSHPATTFGRVVPAPNVVCSVVACAVSGSGNPLWYVVMPFARHPETSFPPGPFTFLSHFCPWPNGRSTT